MGVTVNIKRINIDGADYISGQLIPFKNGNKVSFRNAYRYDFVAYNIPVNNIINEVTGVGFVDINEFNTFFEANFTKANGGGNPVSALLTSYVKAATSRAITASDSILVAIGILEKKSDDNTNRIGATFNGTLTFDKTQTSYNDYMVASNIIIVISSSGKIQGNTEQVTMIGNGTNLPNFSACRQVANTPSFNNSNGYLNLVTFLYDGTRVWYYINQ